VLTSSRTGEEIEAPAKMTEKEGSPSSLTMTRITMKKKKPTKKKEEKRGRNTGMGGR